MVAFPQEGEQFGRYVIERTLGQGGMGVVYEARDKALRRKVALKIVLPSLVVDQDFITRFEREANTLAKLRSRNIVQIIEFGEVEGTVYLVTEYVPDGDLHGWLRTQGPLPTVQALKLVSELSDALADAHRAGVIHRDIKPSNVMLWKRTEDELVPYLIDFGIATEGDSNMTRAGSVVGSLPYMSPERHMGEQATAAGDIYSAGCLLWACLTGRPPYSGTDFQLMSSHINDPIPRLPADNPAANLVNPIISKALAKDVANRYQDAAALSKDLKRAATLLEEGGSLGAAAAAGAPAQDYGSRPGADPRQALTGGTTGFENASAAEVQPTIIKRPGETAAPKETDETVLTGGSGPRSHPSQPGSGGGGAASEQPTSAPSWLPSHHLPGTKGDRPGWLLPAAGGAAAVVLLVIVGAFTSWFGLGGLHGDDKAAATAIAGGVPRPEWASKDTVSCASESLVKKESAETLRQHGVVKNSGGAWSYTGTWPADDATAFTSGLLDCSDDWATDIGDAWSVGDSRCMSDNVDEDAMSGLLAVDLLQPSDPGKAGTEKGKAVKALDSCYAKATAEGATTKPAPGYLAVDFAFDVPRTPGGKVAISVQKKGASTWEDVKGSSYQMPVTDGGAQGCVTVRTTVTYAWGTTKSATAPSCGQSQPKKLVWQTEDKCGSPQLAKLAGGCNSWLLTYEGFAPGKPFTVKLTKNGGKCDKTAQCTYKQTPDNTGKGAVVRWSAPKNWHDRFVAKTGDLSAVIPNS